ncbi:MAG: hypothetical protein ACYDFU_00715 [Nitrospirota bacterium]
METMQSDSKLMLKIKRRGFPVGRLGAHVKNGVNTTFTAFFQEYAKTGLPRIGEGSIRP